MNECCDVGQARFAPGLSARFSTFFNSRLFPKTSEYLLLPAPQKVKVDVLVTDSQHEGAIMQYDFN